MKWRTLIIVAAFGVACGAGAYTAYRHFAGATVTADRADLNIRFDDLDGNPHRLREWRGKLMLVNFWATWCGPCRQEIPVLVQAEREYGSQGFQVLGPAMDRVQAVRRFRHQYGLNYPLFAGDDDIAEAMDILGDRLAALPFSVLIAPDGRIVLRKSGAFTRRELVSAITPFLPKP